MRLIRFHSDLYLMLVINYQSDWITFHRSILLAYFRKRFFDINMTFSLNQCAYSRILFWKSRTSNIDSRTIHEFMVFIVWGSVCRIIWFLYGICKEILMSNQSIVVMPYTKKNEKWNWNRIKCKWWAWWMPTYFVYLKIIEAIAL